MNINQKIRNQGALKARVNQLKEGTKTVKKSYTEKIELTEIDKKRINREIETLKTRI